MYEKAHKIEKRLNTLLSLISSGKYSTSLLSKKLNISTASVSRSIEALRQRGYAIKAIRDKNGWYYELDTSSAQLVLSLKEET